LLGVKLLPVPARTIREKSPPFEISQNHIISRLTAHDGAFNVGVDRRDQVGSLRTHAALISGRLIVISPTPPRRFVERHIVRQNA